MTDVQSFKAKLHWPGQEPPTFCRVRVRGPAPKGGSVFELIFEHKWRRVWCDVKGNRWAVIDRERVPVTWEGELPK